MRKARAYAAMQKGAQKQERHEASKQELNPEAPEEAIVKKIVKKDITKYYMSENYVGIKAQNI